MWIVNSACKVAFFPPKLLPKCWQFLEGPDQAGMLNHLSPLYLQKGMKKAFIYSPGIGPTANTNLIESKHTLHLQELL